MFSFSLRCSHSFFVSSFFFITCSFLITISLRPAFHYHLVYFLLCLMCTFSKGSFSFPSLRFAIIFPFFISCYFCSLICPFSPFSTHSFHFLFLSRFLCCLSRMFCSFNNAGFNRTQPLLLLSSQAISLP